jgi:hypothetical protein
VCVVLLVVGALRRRRAVVVDFDPPTVPFLVAVGAPDESVEQGDG